MSITNEDMVSVYPNPAVNTININYSNFENSTITIFDMLGQKHNDEISLLEENTEINIENLSPGLYFFQIRNKNRTLKAIIFVKE